MVFNKNSQYYPWVIWVIATSFFFSEYIIRVSPNVMVADLINDLQADSLIAGILLGSFYYPYVAMQIPVGMLVDRYGAHRLLYTMAFISAVASAVFSYSDSVFQAVCARGMIGFAAAFGFVGVIRLSATWHPKSRMGLIVGLTQASGMFAGTLLSTIAIVSAYLGGWRAFMLMMAVILMIVGIIIYIFARPKKEHNTEQAQSNEASNISMLAALSMILSNKQSWYNAVYLGVYFAPTAVVAEQWGTNFLQAMYGLSLEHAAQLNGLVFWGWIIGGPFLGFLSDQTHKKNALMTLFGFITLLSLIIIVYFNNIPVYLLAILLFIFGFSSGGVIIGYNIATGINMPQFSGTALAFANMSSVIIGALLLPVVGWILDIVNKMYYNDTNTYSATSFKYALAPLVLGLLIGLLISCKVDDTPYEEKKL